MESAVKVSNRTLLAWVPGWPADASSQWALDGPQAHRDQPACCLWVTKLQSHTVVKSLLTQSNKVLFLGFYDLIFFQTASFSSKELKYRVDKGENVSQGLIYSESKRLC